VNRKLTKSEKFGEINRFTIYNLIQLMTLILNDRVRVLIRVTSPVTTPAGALLVWGVRLVVGRPGFVFLGESDQIA